MHMQTQVAKLDRFDFGPSLVHSCEKGRQAAEFYDKLKVMVPEGEEPTYRPLNDAERDSMQKTVDKVNAEAGIGFEMPTVFAQFKRAFYLTDSVPHAYNAGLGIYTNKPAPTPSPVRDVASPVAEALFMDQTLPSEAGQLDGEQARRSALLGLATLGLISGMTSAELRESKAFSESIVDGREGGGSPLDEVATAMVKERFGDKVEVVDGRGDLNGDYGLIHAAEFDGNVAFIERGMLRGFKRFTVMFEPGTEPVIEDIPDDKAQIFADNTDGNFRPAKVLRYKNVGHLEKTENDTHMVGGIVIGNMALLVAAGTTMKIVKMWVPKAAFANTKAGYTNFLDTIPPTDERAQVMGEGEQVGDTITF